MSSPPESSRPISEKMNRDPNAGKYNKMFDEEFRIAQLVLKPYGGQLIWCTNDYEAFRFVSPAVTILFYPHKTSSTGNISCRVRDQGSKNKKLAAELMIRLKVGSGHWTTFTQKSNATHNEESDLCKREGLEMGWAREQVRK